MGAGMVYVALLVCTWKEFLALVAGVGWWLELLAACWWMKISSVGWLVEKNFCTPKIFLALPASFKLFGAGARC